MDRRVVVPACTLTHDRGRKKEGPTLIPRRTVAGSARGEPILEAPQSDQLQRSLSPRDWLGPVGSNTTASATPRASGTIPCWPLISDHLVDQRLRDISALHLGESVGL